MMRLDGRDTSARHRTGERMSTKLSSITQLARENPRCQFISLAHLLTEDFLRECFWRLKRDRSPGVDGITVKEYGVNLEENIRDLVARLKANRYRPKPVKRAYIPKADGKKRPLGLPSVEDKVVQMGIKRILEAIYEVDFEDVSYGFRPKRNCHGAVDRLEVILMTKPVNHVVDMDIRKFFDTVDHHWLMKCLQQRVKDRRLLNLIGRFLVAGVMEEGKYLEVDEGTPQGGVLSPLLANIYLHYILDIWFERKVKKQLKGYAELIRYADDFVVCFQAGKEARVFGGILKERLAKFGLSIAEDKSRIIEFGRCAWLKARREGRKVDTFDFLGFTFYWARSGNGRLWIARKTSRAKYRQKMKAINQWLREVRNAEKMCEWWSMLRIKLTGHYRYYGVAGNKSMIAKFKSHVEKLAFKWVNRRSQKKSYTWTQFKRFLEHNPLPVPKIYHPFPVCR